jgi:hypothetical protein
MVAVGGGVHAGTVPWTELRTAELRLRENKREEAVLQQAIREVGRTEGAKHAAVVAAQQKLADAEAAYRKACAETNAAPLTARRDDAERKLREAIERDVIGSEPAYAGLLSALAAAERERDALSARATLGAADAKALAALRLKTEELQGVRNAQIRALWVHMNVAAAYKEFSDVNGQWGALHAKGKPVQETRSAMENARKELPAAYDTAAAELAAGKALLAERDRLREEQTALSAKCDALYKAHGGDRSAWRRVEAAFEMAPGADGKSAGQAKVTLWFLPDVRTIRGLIIRPLDHPLLLLAAAEHDLAFVDVQAPRGVEVIEGEPSCFDQGLVHAAKASGHPEVAFLPFLSKGTSAGVLGARNMGFWKPHRCIGVVHHAGGNLHHGRKLTPGPMPHVPFLAINGEFERFGPEGGGHSSGIHGIRGAYGKQTQWVMCREQLLRMRRQDADHLISLVVQPRGDHATWDDEMWWVTALFVRKAAAARIPPATTPPAAEVRCVPVKASDGWLSDARLDHPRYSPAAHADYKGDRIEAFWHVDEEMAKAVEAYHAGQFYLPDLSLVHPVAADWGLIPPAAKATP